MEKSYDVVIIGSGIAGSALAPVLSRIGARVLVVEKKTHPRFVIGESTVPSSTIIFRYLGRKYGVPELGQITHYADLAAHGVTSYPKQTFWFGMHEEGAPLAPDYELMFETLHLPQGPDMHWLRSELDAFLVEALPRYGVDYTDNTEVVEFERRGDKSVLRLVKDGREQEVSADYLIDASGHASFLAKKLDLRDAVPQLHNNTRGIFAHFRDVPKIDDLLGSHPAFRFKRDASTMHHVFPGGWAWVIPFDNNVTSVGFTFNRDAYPLDNSISPEEEVAALLARYPTIKAHLGQGERVTPYLRTDRIQFTSHTTVGDGFILTPHASGFIDPLYSSGILLTGVFIARFARAFEVAFAEKDYRPERFAWIDRDFRGDVEQVDRLVSGSIASYRDVAIFRQYWRMWCTATMLQIAARVLYPDAPGSRIYGAHIPEFREDLEEMHSIVTNLDLPVDECAATLEEIVEPWLDEANRGVVVPLMHGGCWNGLGQDLETGMRRSGLHEFTSFHGGLAPHLADSLQLDAAIAYVAEGEQKAQRYAKLLRSDEGSLDEAELAEKARLERILSANTTNFDYRAQFEKTLTRV